MTHKEMIKFGKNYVEKSNFKSVFCWKEKVYVFFDYINHSNDKLLKLNGIIKLLQQVKHISFMVNKNMKNTLNKYPEIWNKIKKH